MSDIPRRIEIGLLVFPNVQQLDLTGPYEVFAGPPRLDDARTDRVLDEARSHARRDVRVLSANRRAVRPPAARGSTRPPTDEEAIRFVRHQAEAARFMTSVCTGARCSASRGSRKASGRRRTGRRTSPAEPWRDPGLSARGLRLLSKNAGGSSRRLRHEKGKRALRWQFPAPRKEFPASLRRGFSWKLLESSAFSTQISPFSVAPP